MMFKLRSYRERGGALVFGLLLLLLFLFFAALVIDLLRAERAARTLQGVADAAALAGASRLADPAEACWGDGACEARKRTGWQEAKEAVFEALALNPIYGDSGEVRGGVIEADSWREPTNHSYDLDLIANDPEGSDRYGHLEWDFDGLIVRIERGVYFEDPNSTTGERVFLPADDSTIALCTDLRFNSSPLYPTIIPTSRCVCSPRVGADVYLVANGVKVTVTLSRLNTTFARVPFIGAAFIGEIKREAVAAYTPWG